MIIMENLNHAGNNKKNNCLYIELDDFSAFTLIEVIVIMENTAPLVGTKIVVTMVKVLITPY